MRHIECAVRRLRLFVRELVSNQRGAQTIEWIALGILILALMAGAAKAIESNNTLGTKIVEMVGRMLDLVGNEAGGK